MVRIVDLPTTGTVDSNTYVPVFQNGKTKKIAATSLGGGGGSVNDQIHTATSKTTPADADELGIVDSAATWGLKRLTFANLKAWIAGLFVSKAGDTINGNLSVAGTVLATGGGALGYGVGAGGTVVQDTSKSTAVTLNKPSGRITTHNSALSAGTTVTFLCLNSYVSASSCVVTSAIYDGGASYPANYQIDATQIAAGYFTVRIKNLTAGSLSDALTIQFNVHPGATS